MAKKYSKAELKKRKRAEKNKAAAAAAAATAAAAAAAAAASADRTAATNTSAASNISVTTSATNNTVQHASATETPILPAAVPNKNITNPSNSQHDMVPAVPHNDLCESCGLGGDLLCCSSCNLVFHLACYRPALTEIPRGSWYCCFCICDGKAGATSAEYKEKALHSTQQILLLKAAAKQNYTACDDIPPIEPNDYPPRPLLPPILDYQQQINCDEGQESTQQLKSPTTNDSCDDVLPDTWIRQVEGFITAIRRHKENREQFKAILQLLCTEDSIHEQLEIGLQNLSISTNDPTPPIINQAKHNGQRVDWSDCANVKVYEVDERAYKYYKPSIREGAARHLPGQEDTPAAIALENQAKNYEKRKVIGVFKGTGNYEQRRLVLLHFLCDPEIRKIAASIGVNLENARFGRHILECWRRLMRRAQSTTNKNGRLIDAKSAMVHSLSVAAVKTPPKKDSSNPSTQATEDASNTKKKRETSHRSITRVLGFSSTGSGYQNLKKAEDKRAKIADGNEDGWIMIDEKEETLRLTSDYLDGLEAWIESNEKVKLSPAKGDLLIKRDRKGDIVKDELTRIPIRVQRRILLVCPRELHNFMMEDYPESTDCDKVLVSEMRLRKLLKTSCSHVKKFTLRDKLMCGCHDCTIFEDIFNCLLAWRRKFIRRFLEEIKKMREPKKSRQRRLLQEYISQLCEDNEGAKMKIEQAWDAARQMGCDPIQIGDSTYELFSCVLNECARCAYKWSTMVPKLELKSEEMISYVVWGTHHKCSFHGDYMMGIRDGEYFCKECNKMSEEKKKRLKGGYPAVKKMKLRMKVSEKMLDFIKPLGTYEEYLWKMYCHTAHARLLGIRSMTEKCYQWADETGSMLLEMDYSEKYQPVYDREIQSENFGKDADVSMEIKIATYTAKFEGPDKPPAQKKTISYCCLSDEKPQIAATTLENTLMMLEDIFASRKELTWDDLLLIIDIVDGCPAQYKCYTALWTLSVIAHRTGKIYFRCVKCAGHGKCKCDAEGGCHKTFADKAFDKWVMLPEEEKVGCPCVPTHKAEDGVLLSLAEIVQGILQDEDYTHLARSHSARKRKDSKRTIFERHFLLRLRGAAKYLNLKMTGHGFEKGPHMGIRAHHNFVADPELEGYCVMARRIPCLCQACKARFKKPIRERYANPCDDCEYWNMYKGLNDWKEIRFEPTAKCDGDELIDSRAYTLQGVGDRMSTGIVNGGYGAYMADGKYGYYLVQWTQEPWMIEEDCVRTCGAEECQLKKGDWVCHGLWLNYVPRAQHWCTVSTTEVLVRCQTILQSDLKMVPHSSTNELPRMRQKSRQEALALNPLRVADKDHDFLMDASSLREGLDYEVEIPDGEGSESEDDEAKYFGELMMEEEDEE